jgi:hypothetical protein
MRPNLRQRGEGRVGCLFWAVIFAVIALIAVKAVPVKYRSSQLFDFMDEQAKFAQQSRPDIMKKAIMRKSRELQLPLNEKKLTVSKAGGRIRIKAEYTVPLEFPGYTYQWHFVEDINEPIFIW